MERKVFLESIEASRRRLNMAEFLRILVFALGIGALIGILFQAVAFVVPFYHANRYTGLAILLAVVSAFVAAWVRRSTMKQAALVMDSFGFKERIVTAYEHLDEDGEMIRLQREDAINQLKVHKDRIKIPIMPSRKRMVWSIGLLFVMSVLMLVPSETKDRAKELHQIREEAKEKEKEIEEVVEELKELAQEELPPEQLAALQVMIESMESSGAEYKQATSAEMLSAANEKLEYKYENMSSQLANFAQSLQNGASVSEMTAESMQAMAEKLQEMSGNPSDGNQSLASNQGQNGQNGDSQNSQNSGQDGSSDNGQNGQNGGQNGASGNGQNGQNGGQNGGSGNGQNGGQGSGDGSGKGRGEGSNSTTHDYVSIPNAIIDSGNLTGNAQNHDNSEFFRTQNGLSWEGTHISHEAVIGSYEQNAYEGIAAGQYPSGMEDVIKEYFSSFN